MGTLTTWPNSQTLTSSALTVPQINTIIQQLTLGMLGLPQVPNSAAVRIDWPTTGAPFVSTPQDSVCFVSCVPMEDEYDKVRDMLFVRPCWGQGSPKTIIQANNGTIAYNTTQQLQIAKPVTQGDALICFAVMSGAGLISLADNVGGAWVSMGSFGGNPFQAWYSLDSPGGTVTLQFSGLSALGVSSAAIFVCEAGRVMTQGAFDGVATFSNASSSLPLTTGSPDDLVVALGIGVAPTASAAGFGMKLIDLAAFPNGPDIETILTEYQETTVPGTYASTIIVPDAASVQMVCAAAFRQNPALVPRTSNYTRVWRIGWSFYGPQSVDQARVLKSALFEDYFCGQLALSQLFPVSDYPEAVRLPEFIVGQWFERVDLYAEMYEFVTEQSGVPAVSNVEVQVQDQSGRESDFTVVEREC
jgi:hypothetical protein